MFNFLPTIILRHRKENLKKCSLRGLETRKDLQFLSYPCTHYPDLSNYISLSLDAKELTAEDAKYGLFLIDSTWNLAGVMARQVPYSKSTQYRSLPKDIRTAYPRKQTGCIDPTRGLASVEALYMAYLILGRNPAGLLDHYYFKEAFHRNNTKYHRFYETRTSHEDTPSFQGENKTQ